LQASFTFQIAHTTTPPELLEVILNKRANTLKTRGEQPNDFTLKVCGQEEYLIGDNIPLIQFGYIQDCLAKDIMPTLVTLSKQSVPVDQDSAFDNPDVDTLQRTKPSSSTLTLRKKGKHISVWKIEEPFVFTVNGISRLNCDAAHRTVEVCFGFFKIRLLEICVIFVFFISFVYIDWTASWPFSWWKIPLRKSKNQRNYCKFRR